MTTLWLIRRISFLCLLTIPLLSCQFLGPTSITMGRLNYNNVIQQTSKTQTFANIIRVKNHEPTAFLDVTQVNAAVLGQATLTGMLSSVGTHPQNSGSASLGLEYQEAPTIQYQPLLGQALITQVSTPITIDSLTNLYDSDWPIASLITLAVDRLTSGYEDYATAINAIIALDDLGAITISSGVTGSNVSNQSSPASSGSKPPPSGQEPVLIVTLQTTHPYAKGRPTDVEAQAVIRQLWCRLYTVLENKMASCETLPSIIAFSRHALQTAKKEVSKAKEISKVTDFPLHTRSALGILKASTEIPAPLIAFVPSEMFKKITSYPWNGESARAKRSDMSYYTLLPEDEGPKDHRSANVEATQFVRNLILSSRTYPEASLEWCLYTPSTNLDVSDYMSLVRETRLTFLRRYLIIIVSDAEIPGSYVSYSDGEKWYSIDAHDEVSQKNFVLIGQFLTMQATTIQQPPLTPTISVGPSR
jgi:hypothetical protein